MLKSLLSAVAVCVLTAATLFTPSLVSARRCEVKMPVTLLSLYRTSDFIYIGRFDRREEGEPIESSPSYREIPIKNHFSITTTLKGESRKMVVLEESDYIFKTQQSFETQQSSEANAEESDAPNEDEPEQAAEEVTSDETIDSGSSLKQPDEDSRELHPGDQVILFLDKSGDEEEDAPSLSDYQFGLKKLTAERIDSYEARIRELNGIFENGKPTYAELVAWLVRCAEDPNTRWEGTYELMRSFQSLEWQDEHAAELQQKPQTSPAPDGEEPDRLNIRLPKDFDTGDPEFARALTEGQKLILTDALLRREQAADDKSFGFGDRELIELVSKWGDAKVASRLIAQLRSASSDEDVATDLMQSIAAIFNDDELTRIASVYADIRWESAGDQVGAEYLEANEQTDADDDAVVDDGPVNEAADATEPESSEDVVENETDESSDVQAATPEEAVVVKKTYAQFRVELVQKFLERGEHLLAKEKGSAPEN